MVLAAVSLECLTAVTTCHVKIDWGGFTILFFFFLLLVLLATIIEFMR